MTFAGLAVLLRGANFSVLVVGFLVEQRSVMGTPVPAAAVLWAVAHVIFGAALVARRAWAVWPATVLLGTWLARTVLVGAGFARTLATGGSPSGWWTVGIVLGWTLNAVVPAYALWALHAERRACLLPR